VKGYLRLIAAVLVLYILAVVIFVYITGWNSSRLTVNNENVIILNDITKEAEANWSDLSKLDSLKYDVDFVVLDQNNNVRYDSRSGDRSEKITVESAVKNRLPYSYVVSDDRIDGYVVLLDDTKQTFSAMRLTLSVGFAVTGLIIVAGALIYWIHIRKNIIDPFRKMEKFAGKIAEGNLDEPLMIEKNNMFGSFTESFDIMREELAASRERELALQKKEREIVASLSHDLKTPVTGIKLTAELLKAKQEMNGGDEDMISKLDNIYKKADEIDILITDLFSSTLEDLGEFKVNCSDEPSSVLSDIIAKYDDKGLVTQGTLPGVLINVDTKRMGQVIGNIIHNSYKYADTKIDVSYKTVDEFLEMRIRDYGPGVPEEEIALITNKFYRGKKQAQTKSEGSGLGLYIANILMQKMNGELIISGGVEGFEVTLLIPLA